MKATREMARVLHCRRRRGFSLLEAVFTMAILATVSGAVFTLFYSNNFASIISGDQSVAMTDTQTALRTITDSLREAEEFATPTNAGGLRVNFSSGAAVEYYLSGTELKQLDPATGTITTLATDIASWSLTYIDNSMTDIADPMDSTKYGNAVAVDVTITTTMEHIGMGTVSRRTRVMLRNKVT